MPCCHFWLTVKRWQLLCRWLLVDVDMSVLIGTESYGSGSLRNQYVLMDDGRVQLPQSHPKKRYFSVAQFFTVRNCLLFLSAITKVHAWENVWYLSHKWQVDLIENIESDTSPNPTIIFCDCGLLQWQFIVLACHTVSCTFKSMCVCVVCVLATRLPW